MKKIFCVIISILLILMTVITAFAEDLPAPTWVIITDSGNSEKTVTVTTPSYMKELVDYYEYSIDGGKSWSLIQNSNGGEFTVTETSEILIRYSKDNVTSLCYSETVIINKTTNIYSASTGITLLIPVASPVPITVTLSAYEIISGIMYTKVASSVGTNKSFTLFNIKTMLNNKEYILSDDCNWLLPTGDFESQYCKVYSVSSNGVLTEISSEPVMKTLYFSCNHTGIFAVVEDRSYCPGDVNGDGKVTAKDARLTLRAAAGLDSFSEIQKQSGDYDSDGKITSSDARLILRFSAGL